MVTVLLTLTCSVFLTKKKKEEVFLMFLLYVFAKGWMYYTKEQLGEKTGRLQTAVQYLQKAIESDNASGASWYLLGR